MNAEIEKRIHEFAEQMHKTGYEECCANANDKTEIKVGDKMKRKMTDNERPDFLPQCLNRPYIDYTWLKEHCYKTLKGRLSPDAREEHLAVLDLINYFEEHKKIEEQTARDWTPVSERLPRQGKSDLTARYYLIQNEYGDMMVARWDGFGWRQMYQNEYVEDKTVAWMPLPYP